VAFLPSGGGMGHLNSFLKIAVVWFQSHFHHSQIQSFSSWVKPRLSVLLFLQTSTSSLCIRQTVIIITKIINVNKS